MTVSIPALLSVNLKEKLSMFLFSAVGLTSNWQRKDYLKNWGGKYPDVQRPFKTGTLPHYLVSGLRDRTDNDSTGDGYG
jgi:hypothetical protein